MLFKVVLTLLAISVFYIFQLGNVITYDESYTYFTYAYDPLVALIHYTRPNNHQLHSLLVWLSTNLVGSSAVAIRLPVFFAAMLSLSVVYQLAKRFYHARVAWMCLLILAIQPLFVQYALEARGYMLSMLLILLLITRVYTWQLESKKNTYSILLLCGGLLITLPTTIIAIFGILAWGMLFHDRRSYMRLVVLPAMFGCVLGGSFYIFPLMQGWLSQFSEMFGYREPMQFLADMASDFIFIGPATTLLVGAVIVSLFFYKSSKRPFQLMFMLIGSTLCVMLAQWVVLHTLIFPRNLVFFVPIGVLVIGGFLDVVLKNSWVVFALILLSFVILSMTVQVERTQTEDLVETISQHVEENDYLVMGCCEEFPVGYELNQRGLGYLLSADRVYERVIIFPITSPLDVLVYIYSLESIIDQCDIVQWGDYEPYVCVLN